METLQFIDIANALVNLCNKTFCTGTELRFEGEELLCNNEQSANAVADFLDALGYCAVTGYYDPEEDKEAGLEDGLTGLYYITV